MNSGNNRRQLQAIIVAALMLCMAIVGVTQDVSAVETVSAAAKSTVVNVNDAGSIGGKALMKASFKMDSSDVSVVGESEADEDMDAENEDGEEAAEAVEEVAAVSAVLSVSDDDVVTSALMGEGAAAALEYAKAQADAANASDEEDAKDEDESSDDEDSDEESDASAVDEESEGISELAEMEFPEEGNAVCGNSDVSNSTETINWDLRVMANVEEYLKVRKSPDAEAEVVGKMEKGDVGVILGYENGWIHMVSGDLEGYMNEEYCVVGDDAEELADEICDVVAVTNTQGLRIRETADSEGKVIRTLDKDTELKVVSEENVEEEYDADEWVPVKDGSEVGFVSAEYVDVEWNLGEGMTKEEEAAIQKEKEEAAAKGVASRSTSDVVLIAALIQAEGNGQPYEGKVAIANVVMNRVHSGGYPNNVHDVVYQRGQFGPALTGKVAQIVAKGPSQANINAASAALGGANYIGGCTHFKGLASGAQGIVIGSHVFY